MLRTGLLLALLPLGLSAAGAEPAPRSYKQPALIELRGVIEPWSAGYFRRKLAQARKAGADLIVVAIESPGGHLLESEELAELLRETTRAHTVAYVPREALSGAALIALGCDEIVAHSHARIGDMGVIFRDPDFFFRYAPEKIRSNLASELRILANAKGRPPALAEAMVDMDLEVFRAENHKTGEVTFMSEVEHKGRPDADDWELKELVPESAKGRFLTVSGTRAVELKLASATVENEAQLRDRYPSDREWLRYEPDNIDKTIFVLNLWWITAILFFAGMVGLVYEFSAPGTCVGGLIAILCFALFYWSRFLTGTAGWLEVLLFITGVLFLAAELFVIPGFGVAGVLGLGLMVLSLILASQSFFIPVTTEQWATTATSAGTVLGTGMALFVAGAIAITWFGSIPGLNRLVLAPPTSVAEVDDGKLAQAALSVHVGQIGRAESPLVPAGRARFGEVYLDVVSDGGLVNKGQAIRILEAEPGRIVVTAVEE